MKVRNKTLKNTVRYLIPNHMVGTQPCGILLSLMRLRMTKQLLPLL